MIDGFARICFCKSSTSCDLPYLINDVFCGFGFIGELPCRCGCKGRGNE